MTNSIEVHIDELVLHGFAAQNAGQIGDAVEREITRLLQERGLPSGLVQPVQVGRLNAGTFTLQPSVQPGTVGNQIATTVYESLHHEQPSLPKNGH